METNLFKFVTSQNYKELLEKDYTEIKISLENEAYKSVVILSGSLAEAILTDYLLDKNINKFTTDDEKTVKTTEAGLAKLIDFCKLKNFISERTYHMLHAIRDYRNFIHPDKQIRSKLLLSKNEAKLAKNVIDIVIEEISEKRKQSFGCTADQLLDFIDENEDATSLFPHIVKSANSEEDRNIFLIKIAPERIHSLTQSSKRYFDSQGEPCFQSWEEEEHYEYLITKIQEIEECYTICFENSAEESKKNATEQYLRSIKFGKYTEKETWQELFHPEMLRYLSGVDRDLIIDHLHSRLRKNKMTFFIRIISNIAKYLQADEVIRFSETIKNRIVLDENEEYIHPFSNFLNIIKTNYIIQYEEILSLFQNFLKNDDTKINGTISTIIYTAFAKIGEKNPPEIIPY